MNGINQMTGDSIHIISNVKTEKLDSLKVIQNAFIVSLDSISKTGYNQAKGINLYGQFKKMNCALLIWFKIPKLFIICMMMIKN